MTTTKAPDHDRDNATLHSLTGLAQRLGDLKGSDAHSALSRALRRIETISQRLEPIDEAFAGNGRNLIPGYLALFVGEGVTVSAFDAHVDVTALAVVDVYRRWAVNRVGDPVTKTLGIVRLSPAETGVAGRNALVHDRVLALLVPVDGTPSP